MKKSLLFVWILLVVVGIAGYTIAQDAEDVEAADYLFFFGGGGGFAGSTEGVSGLVVKADGNMLVADVFQHISEFNMYGELVEVHEADAAGSSFGEIVAMIGDPAGNIYVGTVNPSAINVYDADWTLKQTITPEGDLYPLSLAYDNINELLYASMTVFDAAGNFERKIVAYNATGEVEHEIPIQLNFPHPNQYRYGGIAINSDGNIMLAYGGISRSSGSLDVASGAIQLYQPDGTLLSQRDATEYMEEEVAVVGGTDIFRYFPTPYGLTLDSAGRSYAYEVYEMSPLGPGEAMRISGVVTVTAPNGTLLRQFTVSQSDSPVAAELAFSPDENLLYVSTTNYVHIISLVSEPPFTSVEMVQNGRLRDNPDGAVVGAVEAGKLVIVTGQNEAGDWLKIRYNGAEAWVAAFLTGPVAR